MTFVLPSIGSGIIASPTSAPAAAFNTYSVDLDGTNDYVNAVSPSALSNVEAISVWFKPDSAITSIGLKGYLLGLGGSDIGIALGGDWFGPVTNEVISVVNVNHVWSYTGSGVTVSSGTWHHLGVRWESSSSSTNSGVAGYDIYLDGVKVGNGFGTYSSGGGAKITTSAITAGARNRNGTIEAFYNGLIDELGIFTSAVSESDLLAMYNSGVPADLSSYSPALWWRMGDIAGGTGSTITDQGSGGNDGTLVNGPTFSTDVPTAFSNTYSVAFDGTDDKMQAGNSSTIASASVFTISAWARFHGVGQIFLASGTVNQDRIYMELINTQVGVVVKNGAGGAARWTTSLSANTWYHIACTVDSGTSKLFVNGVYRATNTSIATLSATAGDDLSIGTDNGNGMIPWAFDGDVDEVAIFNTALSDGGGLSIGDTAGGDIATLYNSGTPGDLSSFNPTSWWRMGDNDGGTGTTITDQGSEGNDGTLVNGPTFSTDVPTFNTYSVDFDGTDDFVSTSSFDLTTNKTVSFWIKLDSISAAGVYLFGKGAAYYSYITADGRTMYKYNGISSPAINISPSDAITTGVWQHIVITGNGSTSVLYKNGVSIGTGVDVTPLGLDRFAGDSVGGSRFVDGLMDEVAVWDAELSANDISSIYNSGVPNDLSDASSYDTDRTSNLVHWWRMGENDGATGTTITDQGSGGNDATLVNGPTFSTDTP